MRTCSTTSRRLIGGGDERGEPAVVFERKPQRPRARPRGVEHVGGSARLQVGEKPSQCRGLTKALAGGRVAVPRYVADQAEAHEQEAAPRGRPVSV
jgi:hypothetical protein